MGGNIWRDQADGIQRIKDSARVGGLGSHIQIRALICREIYVSISTRNCSTFAADFRVYAASRCESCTRIRTVGVEAAATYMVASSWDTMTSRKAFQHLNILRDMSTLSCAPLK